jgi:hypothetical protein
MAWRDAWIRGGMLLGSFIDGGALEIVLVVAVALSIVFMLISDENEWVNSKQ